MTSVLLAEDDPAISEPLARALRREGYDVDVAADGPGTLEAARNGGVDLIVLDIGLPKLDGLEVCRRIRSSGHSIPVLILTARADEVDTVIGLDAGADDYVTKPFRLAELLARVRALLRRGTSETKVVQGVRVDTDARRAGDRADLQGVRLARADGGRGREGRHQGADHAAGLGQQVVGLNQDPGHARLVAAAQARRRRAQPAIHHDGARRGVQVRARRLGEALTAHLGA
jgi:CheY-like chemotaxis protein